MYFLEKDPERKMFTKNTIVWGGYVYCEGRARLNVYLHLAQNVFIAKTGAKLFSDDIYACQNGATVSDIQENYSTLWGRRLVPNLTPEIADFLDKLYLILQNAPLGELIQIACEDAEWLSKQQESSKNRRLMNPLAHIDEYRTQYADILDVMERMSV